MPLLSDYASTRKTVLQKNCQQTSSQAYSGGGGTPPSESQRVCWQNGEFYNTLRV